MYVHFGSYRAPFFLECEIFRTKVAEKVETYVMFNNFFRGIKSCRLWDNVENYGTAGQTTDNNITRQVRFTCWITKASDTHSEYVILTTFLQQPRFRERLHSVTLESTLRVLYSLQQLLWAYTQH